MKILFEEYCYETSLLTSCLGERYFKRIDDLRSKPNYVGYYFNFAINEAVFILPKVFIFNDNKAFGIFKPEELVSCTFEVTDKLKEYGIHKIIFELPLWMYQAMTVYNRRKEANSITEYESVNRITSSVDDGIKTELDLVLGLLRFHKNNQDLFVRIAKISHSQQHKISWTKTVSRNNAAICDDVPVYMDVVTKKKTINHDEEIIIIFYSVLNQLKTKYGFDVNINQRYDLITGKNFERLLNKGTKILKSLKYKYFNDKLLELWRLLYMYFERSEKIRTGRRCEEVLMVKDFNLVFEDMIDCLTGDENLPKNLKFHKDGKQLDHIYRYKSLISDDDIYYVGDSKYYKDGNNIDQHSIAKQFTYAKNVIQYNINNNCQSGVRQRDDLTEGYNITPNFFIRAFVDSDLDFTQDNLTEDGQTYDYNRHFENRLFDRDTLHLKGFSVNFLFVLSSYIARSDNARVGFRDRARYKFRQKMVEHFNAKYSFYKITPADNIEEFIRNNIMLLKGKMYRPSDMEDSFILAFLNNTAADSLPNIEGVFTTEDWVLV